MNRRALASVLAVCTLGLALSACADRHRQGHHRERRPGDQGRQAHGLHPPALRAVPVQRGRRDRRLRRGPDGPGRQGARSSSRRSSTRRSRASRPARHLNTGKCDIAAAGMTITDERDRRSSTSPTRTSTPTQALLVKKGAGIDSLERPRGQDARRPGPAPPARSTPRRTPPKGVELKEFEDLALLLSGGQDRPGRRRRSTTTAVLYDYAKTEPGHRGRRPSSTPASSTASASRRTGTTSCSKPSTRRSRRPRRTARTTRSTRSGSASRAASDHDRPRHAPTDEERRHGDEPAQAGPVSRGVQYAVLLASLVARGLLARLGRDRRRSSSTPTIDRRSCSRSSSPSR